jgi:hypothetical protein
MQAIATGARHRRDQAGQARELAAVVIEAADEIDRWAGALND